MVVSTDTRVGLAHARPNYVHLREGMVAHVVQIVYIPLEASAIGTENCTVVLPFTFGQWHQHLLLHVPHMINYRLLYYYTIHVE